MAEEEMVSGEGWISDDSSFYGEYDMLPRHRTGSHEQSAAFSFAISDSKVYKVLFSSLSLVIFL
jgi:hypothetical protein